MISSIGSVLTRAFRAINETGTRYNRFPFSLSYHIIKTELFDDLCIVSPTRSYTLVTSGYCGSSVIVLKIIAVTLHLAAYCNR